LLIADLKGHVYDFTHSFPAGSSVSHDTAIEQLGMDKESREHQLHGYGAQRAIESRIHFASEKLLNPVNQLDPLFIL
jgi:hypothetical protein